MRRHKLSGKPSLCSLRSTKYCQNKKTSLGNTENWASEKANGKNHKISRVAFQGTLKRGTRRVRNGSIKLTEQPDSGAATNLHCFCVGLSPAWSRAGWSHCAPSHLFSTGSAIILLLQCPRTILHSAMKAGATHGVQRWRGDPKFPLLGGGNLLNSFLRNL